MNSRIVYWSTVLIAIKVVVSNCSVLWIMWRNGIDERISGLISATVAFVDKILLLSKRDGNCCSTS